MTDLTIIKHNGGAYIDSREVAELIGKTHRHLLRDIRGYIEIMQSGGLPKNGQSDFFVENSYINTQNKEMPCYLLSKMGCEMVANKLTGEKGVLFTAAYVKRFNEMETAERAEAKTVTALPAPRLGEYNACARIVIRILRELGAMPEDMILFLQGLYQPFGISIATDTVIDDADEAELQQPRFFTAKEIAVALGIYSVNGNPHAQAVSCILNENLFINESHKTVVTLDCGDHIGISVKYDAFAVQSVMDWITESGFPEEVYGFERTYTIRYID